MTSTEFWDKTFVVRMRTRLFALALTACTAGCSLLVQFDPEGQPCSAAKECLNGYANPTLKARDLQESFRDLMIAEGIAWMP